MPSLSDVALLLSQTIELSLLVKATIILAAGLVVTQVTRTARAAARHLVIAASFAALIALPIWLAAAPAMTIDVPVTPSVNAGTMVRVDPAVAQPSTDTGSAPPSRQWFVISPVDALRGLWLLGAVAFLIPVAAVGLKLSMIRRTGLPTAWRRGEIADLARQRGITTTVDVIEHEAVPGPMTFGVFRPVIVLPPDAREWSDAQLRRALMHELEHIHRGDWLMQILARVVAA
ncbi:MAG TPA: M56 family metallopeptidase, partial [Vicinamibacterales bacterium]|nr:M56 family metallopeptidase [Vicinamibacterales bacterium]